MEYFRDTIAAISTPTGTGAIHIIRLSGEDAFEIVNTLLRNRDIKRSAARKAIFTKLYHNSELLDEVVLTKFESPGSYTGEDMVEISCHGNQYLAERILEILLLHARLALPGEFTQRAYMNSKLDLTQAEAVGDLLSAKTRFAQKSALNQLEGKLASYIKPFLEQLTKYRIELELEIDFSEDDTGELDLIEMSSALKELSGKLRILSESGHNGIILREGYRVCLAGQPNVGKSSIFNKMLSTERAIVTPEPGTTRDYLEEALSLDGFLVRLYDTAGIRNAGNEIEQIGIRRSFDIMKDADLLVYVYSKEEIREVTDQDIATTKMIKVVNKIDLLDEKEIQEYRSKGYIPASTETRDGLEELKKAIVDNIDIDPESFPEALLTNNRQIAAVLKSVENIDQAIMSIEAGMSVEFIAFDLQEASRNLEDIIGVISSDDILNQIFAGFCIGK